jgi:adenylosuccinate synthase
MSLWVVVGGQFGSEGKGKVSAVIARRENIDICVRCGGPNSGHSFVDTEGKPVVLRQLPTGFVNSRTRLLLPAGALVDPIVLKREIEVLGISPLRIGIDPQCFVIEERDRETERNLRLNERLSSTLCGVGSAISRRVLRGDDAKLVKDALGEYPWLADLMVRESVSKELNLALDRGKSVLIEGTQGFGLSIYHSEHYPRCTSRDTTASGFLSEVGVSPRLVTEIIVVFRTFPIRVAGEQAGPLKDETTWEWIRAESGCPVNIEERTSVTNNLRRVARFDWELAQKAIMVNRPTRLALNGLDYLNYGNRAVCDLDSLTAEARTFIDRLAGLSSCNLLYLGTGPHLDDEFFYDSTGIPEAQPKSWITVT